MLDFMSNNKIYELQSTNQVSVILSQFDSNYIMDVISDTLQQMFNNFDVIPKPNSVQAFEDVFKELYIIYPNDAVNIDETRYESYSAIIKIICSKFNLQFNQTEELDMYTMAFYLYDFFVAKFNYYLVNFYARYVNVEKDNIYSSLNLESLRKSKDTSTAYGKLVFDNDIVLSTVTANLPLVLNNLRQINTIPDETIYRYTYGNNQDIINLFTNHIAPVNGLYNIYNSLLFNEILYGSIITQIRLRMQMEFQAEINAKVAANLSK